METQVADLLGGERILGQSIKSNLDLARATREGLPGETALQLVEAMGLHLSAAGPLGPLLASLHGEQPARLTPQQSDLVIRTASILAKAIDVLGSRAKASHWLTTSNHALGDEIPITLLDTSAGEHEVEAVLDRIEYGVYS
jgi:putative toxin-antitoxin system antitoxin component (TIGR02293 family)